MTFLLYASGSLLAAFGTRLAAAAFVGAAAFAVLQPATGSPVVVWTAAMAAGLICAGVSPRRIAPAAIGAGAAIAAGSAENAAVVLALWAVGTGAVLSARPPGEEGRRWAFAVLQADLLVAATVAYTALNFGFAAWPERLGTVGPLLLALSALVRLPAVGWPESRPEAGLVLVRAQTVVLLTLAVGAAPLEQLEVIVATGAGLFALAPLARREAVRDGAQEAALVAMTLGVTGLAWDPADWVWGALAGGALTHYLRLSGGADGGGASTLSRAMSASGGIGLPLLPAATAVIVAALTHESYVRIAVVAGIAAGLAARAWTSADGDAHPQLQGLRGWREAAVLGSAAAALGAPLLELPRPPGGATLPWPPMWAAGLVGALAVAGFLLPRLAPVEEPARGPRSVPFLRGIHAAVRMLDPPGGNLVLRGLLVVIGVVAAGLLVLGWIRGFL